MKTFWGIIFILFLVPIFAFGDMIAEVMSRGGNSKAITYIILGYIPFGIGLLFSFTKFSKLDWSNDLFYLLFKNFTKIINNISNKSRNKLNEAKDKLRSNLEDEHE